MTTYYNPLTGSMESKEEMLARPPEQHGETVLPVDSGTFVALEGAEFVDEAKRIWEGVRGSLPPGSFVIYSTERVRSPFWPITPSTAPDSLPPQTPQPEP